MAEASNPRSAGPPGAPAGHPPGLPSWLVPRPRLTERLARGALGPLTVVVGPVGAGKTALALDWVHTGRLPGPVAWVACDGRVEDPAVFWGRLTAALRQAGVAVSDADPAGPAQLLVAGLAADLDRHGGPVVLVLDDFQPAPGSPLAEGVSCLLRHTAPDVLRLVVLARRDPPLHLHRERLTSGLAELRTADLAFDDQEAAALLAQHGIELPRQAVSTLRRRTDGWAAGLRLAAMSMERQSDPAGFVAQFAGDDEAIASYLIEEVLDVQPPGMRRLLLRTSVLERMNAELAAELAGEEAGAHFGALVRENSFLQPVGQGWYRCHQMFADVLRMCLRHEAPGLVGPLHDRAAAWLGAHGLLADAVRHLLAAGEHDRAARLIVHRLAIGQVLGLGPARLPAEPTPRSAVEPSAESPEGLLLAAAAAHARGEEQAVVRDLAAAEGLLDESPAEEERDRIARCRLAHAVIRMERLRLRAPEEARAAAADAERAAAQLPPGATAERPEIAALTLALRGGGELRAGGLKAAETSLTKALKAAVAAGSPALRRDSLIELALVEALRGRFRAAEELVSHAAQPPLPSGPAGGPARASLHLVRAWLALAHGVPPAARRELARAEAVLAARPDPFLSDVGALVGEVARMAVRGGEAGPGGGPAAGRRLPGAVLQTAQAVSAALLARRPQGAEGGGAGGVQAGTAAGEPRPEAEQPPFAERLSPREQDVLDRLAQMMTTEEIAEELCLSVNTVKTHLKSVYRKLAVSRRSAAVRRARSLNLL